MGFFRSISRAIGGVARAISRPLSRITSFAQKALSFVQKPMSMINKLTAPLQKAMGGLLDKLPFGKFIKPFAQKFLSNALAYVAGGPLGALAKLSSFAAGAGKAVDLLSTINKAVGGLQNGLSPEGIKNVAEIFAHSQAQKILGRL